MMKYLAEHDKELMVILTVILICITVYSIVSANTLSQEINDLEENNNELFATQVADDIATPQIGGCYFIQSEYPDSTSVRIDMINSMFETVFTQAELNTSVDYHTLMNNALPITRKVSSNTIYLTVLLHNNSVQNASEVQVAIRSDETIEIAEVDANLWSSIDNAQYPIIAIERFAGNQDLTIAGVITYPNAIDENVSLAVEQPNDTSVWTSIDNEFNFMSAVDALMLLDNSNTLDEPQLPEFFISINENIESLNIEITITSNETPEIHIETCSSRSTTSFGDRNP